MNRSIGRTWAIAGLVAVLASTLPMQAAAGKRGGGDQHNMPTFSGGLILKHNGDGAIDPELIAKIKAYAAKRGYSLNHLRKLAAGGDVLQLGKALPPAVLRELADEMARLDDRIDYIEPDVVMIPMGHDSNDKHAGAQWNLNDPTAGIYLNDAWTMSKGRGVVVAIVDSGVRPHVDLMPNLLPGHDFISNTSAGRDGDGRDNQAWDEGTWSTAGQCGTANLDPEDSLWHGTHVAGIIAAAANNKIGIAGVAPQAKLVPVRAVGRCGGFTSDIIDGMLWAAGIPVSGAPLNHNPAQVINLSLGSLTECSRSFQSAINAVRAQGVVVVAAAGNSDTDVARVSPAGCNGVIAVAATDRDGRRAYYSNHGRRITVAAPGGDMRDMAEGGILSLYNAGTKRPANDMLAYMQGTSMAAPHVTGVVALMLARNPGLTPERVTNLLKATARPMDARTCRGGCGGGLLDAGAAVAGAATAP